MTLHEKKNERQRGGVSGGSMLTKDQIKCAIALIDDALDAAWDVCESDKAPLFIDVQVAKNNLTALETHLDGTAWLPIASAPKDGTRLMFAIEGTELIAIGFWWLEDDTSVGHWFISGWNNSRYQPTHWMPLPPPPQEQQ